MRLTLTLTASALVLAACTPASDDTAMHDDATAAEQAAEASAPEALPEETALVDADASEAEHSEATGVAHWGYTGDLAAENWGTLSADWATCDVGTQQSPIDFSGGASADAPAPELDWVNPAGFAVVDNGHTIQANLPGAGGMTLNGTSYNLVQLHFHAPSEHTVNGEQFPMEVHFVHASDEGALAVVGVMFAEGDAEPGLAPIWDNLPDGVGESEVAEELDLGEFLPGDLTAWRYAGSLTTPPCSEGVAWTVIQEPITASAEQLAAFMARHGGNYRPVQPLDGRDVGEADVTNED